MAAASADGSSVALNRLAIVAAAVTVLAAGAIHLALTAEHLEEPALFGWAFLAMAAYQVALGAALLLRPGPRAYAAGVWGSLVIVATYLLTRVVPPPTAEAPEPVTGADIVATTLEVVAIVLLLVAMPGGRHTRSGIPAWLAATITGLTVPIAWVFLTGAFQWTPDPAPVRWPLGVVGGAIGPLTPAVSGFVTDRLFLFLPWWAALAGVLLGALAAANVGLAIRRADERRISCRRRRASLLGLLPATFAAPVCCGVPIAALLGLSTATLFAAAPFATAAAVGLLGANLVALLRAPRGPVECQRLEDEALDRASEDLLDVGGDAVTLGGTDRET